MQAAQRTAGYSLSSRTCCSPWSQPPYVSLLTEDDDLNGTDTDVRLAAAVEEELRRQNLEYANRQDTRRLGPVETRGG